MEGGRQPQESYPKGVCLVDLIRYWPSGLLSKSFNSKYVQSTSKPKRDDLEDHLNEEILDAWNIILDHIGFMDKVEKDIKESLCELYADCLLFPFSIKERKSSKSSLVNMLKSMGKNEKYKPKCLKDPTQKKAKPKAAPKAAASRDSDDEDEEGDGGGGGQSNAAELDILGGGGGGGMGFLGRGRGGARGDFSLSGMRPGKRSARRMNFGGDDDDFGGADLQSLMGGSAAVSRGGGMGGRTSGRRNLQRNDDFDF
eukprot:NODE_628_length_2519_cov_18.259182_g536_i0.p2 GENE.NODE_628_length_2519_cov_18.259182_g536_i0~~NODE_628_length_2519_cov_18.259182_g536_i0.p2  ORF type:complete len:255 (+),score=84.12 NODE_628_length_2519_cov_18.259182_g536_i0:1731-2495(+)